MFGWFVCVGTYPLSNLRLSRIGNNTNTEKAITNLTTPLPTATTSAANIKSRISPLDLSKTLTMSHGQEEDDNIDHEGGEGEGLHIYRKLTEDEIRELRIRLLPYFHVSGGLGVEDVSDILDYTFAMLNNFKSIDYVVKELVGMEMDFCTPEVASKVGDELTAFIQKINGGGENEPEEEEYGEQEGEKDGNDDDDANDEEGGGDAPATEKTSRVISLKKVRFVS